MMSDPDLYTTSLFYTRPVLMFILIPSAYLVLLLLLTWLLPRR